MNKEVYLYRARPIVSLLVDNIKYVVLVLDNLSMSPFHHLQFSPSLVSTVLSNIWLKIKPNKPASI